MYITGIQICLGGEHFVEYGGRYLCGRHGTPTVEKQRGGSSGRQPALIYVSLTFAKNGLEF